MRRPSRPVLAAAIVGGILLVALVGAIAAVAFAARPLAEIVASRLLDRPLRVGTLHVRWGNPLAVRITDLSLANPSWASAPEMLRVDEIAAEIDLAALLHGSLRYERLRLTNPRLVLERGAAAEANWRFPGGGGAPAGALALVPKNRTQFPTLVDFALDGGMLIYRVANHRDLRLRFDTLAIRGTPDDAKATIDLKGAYNDVPVRLTGTTAGFGMLRDAATPFAAEFAIASEAGSVGFRGTLTEPLDFEGVRGRIDIEAASLGAFLRPFGVDLAWAVPLGLGGGFVKDGEHWGIDKGEGTLAQNRFTGALALDEGGRGEPDAVTLDLAFAQLDLAAVLGNKAGEGASDWRDRRLDIDRKPGLTIDARLKAQDFGYGRWHVADVAFHGRSLPGALSLDSLGFAVSGGRVAAAGSAQAGTSGTHVSMRLALSGAEAGRLAQLVEAPPGEIAGTIEAGAALDATARTAGELLAGTSGVAVLTMRQGRIARDLVEKASSDLKALFRNAAGTLPLVCLLGVADLDHGVARLAALRLRTPDTTVTASGSVDLAASRVDLTIKADSAGSQILALDLPLHIAGPFAKLAVQPVLGGSGSAAPDPSAEHALPRRLQALVDANPCRDHR